MNNCPDLLAALRDLHTVITTLTDELRQHRLGEQASIERIIELHRPQQVQAIENPEASWESVA
jgi:hypothetical protein